MPGRRSRHGHDGADAPDYSAYGYKSTAQMYRGMPVYRDASGHKVVFGTVQELQPAASPSFGLDWGFGREAAAHDPLRQAGRQVAHHGTSWFGASSGGGGAAGLLAAAQRYEGRGETRGDNRGPDIAYFHAGTGAREGAPWCASFATTATWDAGLPIRKTASVADLASQYRQHGAWRDRSYAAQPGDMMFMTRGRGGGHVGIVQSRDEFGGITAMEGNAGGFPSVVRSVYHDAADVARRVRGFGDTAALIGGGHDMGSSAYASLEAPQTPRHRRGGGGRGYA